jgi:hypothetical protein
MTTSMVNYTHKTRLKEIPAKHDYEYNITSN